MGSGRLKKGVQILFLALAYGVVIWALSWQKVAVSSWHLVVVFVVTIVFLAEILGYDLEFPVILRKR